MNDRGLDMCTRLTGWAGFMVLQEGKGIFTHLGLYKSIDLSCEARSRANDVVYNCHFGAAQFVWTKLGTSNWLMIAN